MGCVTLWISSKGILGVAYLETIPFVHIADNRKKDQSYHLLVCGSLCFKRCNKDYIKKIKPCHLVDCVTCSILTIHTHVIYFSYSFGQSINSKKAYIQYGQKN